ncbi:hypothetical protein COW36_10350 [bacterium (Candidatus Blackallbacteria) CG17_big_fil_post_rev_8_21_14_2_50_48_46]|uniref:Uncharacterized protein n=1 Tax=bacterium (Candidatus Blackallbacteria) CG17_big_fil_post_rev_8_21_14_2_50_48_46 TaxID=2014261 RepID=A0A2M7G515_9BACT|nr:MAG: hypothetical protein COW64_20120 [bacterium (Candidatus Blackallbacteria) CG18_big_fil_WC_8_21_14_2_50_49_26]PIW17033.1 MAG: hypothetical protein COW36_10350 [bacterium (Candidatus Blackallbacteria) CG17_big_fil_post_rev_8_21_14_2_50_48_46]PIW48158.1 MAG: hypothetical protein COW20_10325 [bacterium (Candidatus Blackallbacteria) CG13_big_fil_rev_8_21_14_2_50_49_14]
MQRKELLKDLVQSGAIKSIEDINSLVKDIYKETFETMLEAELEAELGYSRYDYRLFWLTMFTRSRSTVPSSLSDNVTKSFT